MSRCQILRVNIVADSKNKLEVVRELQFPPLMESDSLLNQHERQSNKDPDHLGLLVWESMQRREHVLVFCATKDWCEKATVFLSGYSFFETDIEYSMMSVGTHGSILTKYEESRRRQEILGTGSEPKDRDSQVGNEQQEFLAATSYGPPFHDKDLQRVTGVYPRVSY